jgi:predicted nucleic acid-binding protein
VLIDSGPLIALFDRSDRHHEDIKTFLRTFRGELVTTWPVLTEVSHLLDFHQQVQIDFLRWVERGGVRVYAVSVRDLTAIIDPMEHSANIPMDLADATLMYVAHTEGIREIISIDSDFDIYRTLKQGTLTNILRSR